MFVRTNPGQRGGHTEATASILRPQRFAEADQAELADLVGREAGDGDQAEDAGHVQDVGLVAGEQGGGAAPA